MISVSQARPKISQWKERTGLKLLYVPQFVQEQWGMQWHIWSHENPSAQCDRRHGRAPERPPSDTRWQAAAAEAQSRQVRILPQKIGREGLWLADQGRSDTTDDAHRSPCAWICSDDPSVRTMTWPRRSLRSTVAPLAASDAST